MVKNNIFRWRKTCFETIDSHLLNGQVCKCFTSRTNYELLSKYYIFLRKNGFEQRVFSRLLVKIPKELLHAGGAAGKVGAAETTLLQLGPVGRMLGVRLDRGVSVSVLKKNFVQPTRIFCTSRISWNRSLIGCPSFFILVLKIGRNS